MDDNRLSWENEVEIRKDSISPLYLQVQDGLKSWIISGLREGTLSPGDRVPSENELSQALDVSSTTVKRALEELRRQGFIQRIQGRGSFITGQKKLELDLQNHFSLTIMTLDQGMQPVRRTLERLEIAATASIANPLKVPVKARIGKLVRLRLMDETPIAVDTSYIPLDLFPGMLAEYRDEVGLYALLEGKYHNGPLHVSDTIEPILINEFESNTLGVEIGSPALLIERIAYGRGDTPVEFNKSVIRGDICRFSIDLRKDAL
jgi:GntR family transcriptional regulator